jgi:hypothetical protein
MHAMEPMTYGQMVAAHLEDLRREADAINRARRAQRPTVAAWRIYSGRLLVRTGEWLQGCCDVVATEARPQIRVIG